MEQNECTQELELLKAKRELEAQTAKDTLRIERAKSGVRKTVIKTICFSVVGILFLMAATWLITLFMPDNAQKAFDVVTNLFK